MNHETLINRIRYPVSIHADCLQRRMRCASWSNWSGQGRVTAAARRSQMGRDSLSLTSSRPGRTRWLTQIITTGAASVQPAGPRGHGDSQRAGQTCIRAAAGRSPRRSSAPVDRTASKERRHCEVCWSPNSLRRTYLQQKQSNATVAICLCTSCASWLIRAFSSSDSEGSGRW